MNQKLVQSLVQIILLLSDEERQYLEREVQKHSIAKQIEDLKHKLKKLKKNIKCHPINFLRNSKQVNLEIQSTFLRGIHIMK